jgi:hypothetical protein
VLIAGAGPVGLTAAIELARHRNRCRVADPVTAPPQYAKAVGVQSRTLEIFEAMGCCSAENVPFAGVFLAQYETERILAGELRRRGVAPQRGAQGTRGSRSRAMPSRRSTCSATSRWTGLPCGLRGARHPPDRQGDRRSAGEHPAARPRPVGEEVVGRTVRNARAGIGADPADLDFVVRRESHCWSGI